MLVAQGGKLNADKFFERYWPEARVVSDSDLSLYRGFGLARGSVLQMFGFSVWGAGMRASRKGHRLGQVVGDPWIMPGAFLVSKTEAGGRVLEEHNFRHAGDLPDFQVLLNSCS